MAKSGGAVELKLVIVPHDGGYRAAVLWRVDVGRWRNLGLQQFGLTEHDAFMSLIDSFAGRRSKGLDK